MVKLVGSRASYEGIYGLWCSNHGTRTFHDWNVSQIRNVFQPQRAGAWRILRHNVVRLMSSCCAAFAMFPSLLRRAR